MNKSWDPQWKKFYQQSDGNKYPQECIIRFVARNYYQTKDRSRINILDLGCGPGAIQWYLSREGFTAHGIDASPTAIKKAQVRLRREKLTSDLRVGDFTALPYPDASMDAVVDAASIQHNSIRAIQKIATEIYRVLKPGGKFFGILIASSHRLSNRDYKTHFFTRSEIRTLFRQLQDLMVDYLAYTEANQTKSIKFWLVQGTK